MSSAVFFALGLGLGISVGILFVWLREKDHQRTMARREAENERMLSNLKESFSALSLEALSKNSEEFFKLANQKMEEQGKLNSKEMEGKKGLIDSTLKQMESELKKVHTAVGDLEKDRQKKFGELSNQLKHTAQQTEKLSETTNQLHKALSSQQARGQWGERMAEDVLRLAGFVEGTNYLKQSTIKSDEGISRPDYTFYMPQDRVVHMDVKFPLDNYMNYIESETDMEREAFKKKFLEDARKMVNDVTKRNYVDVSNNTLDYMILFVPNEQVYSFLNETDRDLMDKALQKKIILCSPMTLYAVLSVIHQAVENFAIEQRAAEIKSVLSQFKKQWDKFSEAMEKVGRQIDSSQKAFSELTTTRRKMLERSLDKIEDLQVEHKPTAENPRGFKVIENVEPESKTKN